MNIPVKFGKKWCEGRGKAKLEFSFCSHCPETLEIEDETNADDERLFIHIHLLFQLFHVSCLHPEHTMSERDREMPCSSLPSDKIAGLRSNANESSGE